MKKIPIFSSEMPDEPSSEDADLYAAFQAIKYAEDDPPEGEPPPLTPKPSQLPLPPPKKK